MYYVAFSLPTDPLLRAWETIVEIFFYLDLTLNFFCEFVDPDTHLPISDLKSIALNYASGWFFIDFISVFPFSSIFDTGALTKLFRLFRLPRLIKLIDISRFSKLLKSFQGKNTDEVAIVKEYFILYIYNIFRLIIIAIMLTYFVGCIVIFFSNEFNSEEDIENGDTFVKHFGLDHHRWTDNNRLVISCYFAITTFATVGYGDYFAISARERVLTAIIQLGGVAFFSYIMGNFVAIIANYDIKMGSFD